MTNKTQHTPLPWTLNAIAPSQLTIEDQHGGEGAPLFSFPLEFYSQDPDTLPEAIVQFCANRRFVLTAVNSHYDLLAALKALFAYMDAPEREEELEIDCCEPEWNRLCGVARAAIVKAEEGV